MTGLPSAPSKLLGIGKSGSSAPVNGSNTVGNPFDFENNNPFTIALRFSIKNTLPATINLIAKMSTRGYYISAIPTSGENTFGIRFTEHYTTSNIMRHRYDFIYGSEYILIVGTTGSLVTGTHMDPVRSYNRSGTFNSSQGVQSGGNAPSSTIKNTTSLEIITNSALGYVGELSVWNINMTDGQKDDLALRYANDTVKGHALYTSNCKGYWREVMGKKLIKNEVDRAYDITLTGI